MNNKAYQELLREAKRREQKANRVKKVKVDKEKKTQEHNEAAAVDEEAEAEPEFTTKTTFIADGILSLTSTALGCLRCLVCLVLLFSMFCWIDILCIF